MSRKGKKVRRLRSGARALKLIKLRPALAGFAGLMEHVLRENDWKGKSGWRYDCDADEMVEGIESKVSQLKEAVALLDGNLGVDEEWDEEAVKMLLRQSADLANYAMMFADLSSRKILSRCDGPVSRDYRLGPTLDDMPPEPKFEVEEDSFSETGDGGSEAPSVSKSATVQGARDVQ